MSNHPCLRFEPLRSAVAGSAGVIRCRRRLQPAGGPGDKIFPPTFADAVYAIEKRRIPGRSEPVQCVLLHSVQSQGNRMEQAVQEAVDGGRPVDCVVPVPSLEPHVRLRNAIVRDMPASDQAVSWRVTWRC